MATLREQLAERVRIHLEAMRASGEGRQARDARAELRRIDTLLVAYLLSAVGLAAFALFKWWMR